MLERQSEEGAFQVEVLLAKAFGGSGEVERLWMLCDAPLPVYSLLAFGLVDDDGSVTIGFGPTGVHSQQHLGPILAFGAASSGMNRQ